MRRNFIILFIVILMITLNSNLVIAEEKNKNVLIINSYHRGLEWSDRIEEGIISQLHSEGRKNVDIKIEYMDGKENNEKLYNQKLVDIYKYKYKDRKFDLIICSDNIAFDFLINNRNELFIDIPVVFCGVNNIEVYDLTKIYNMTGISENIDIKENIKLIEKLHPNMGNIATVIDKSYIGDIILKDLMDIKSKNKFKVNINVIRENTVADTIKKINLLPKDTVILFMSTYIEKNKYNKLYVSELVHYIRGNTDKPVYSVWDTALDYGIIGGKITSSVEQGKYAGEVALKLLKGESINNIPIKYNGVESYIFDYNELKNYSIDINKLPMDSIIINKPVSAYSIAKNELQKVAILLSLIFLVIIVFLGLNIFKRKKLESELKESRKCAEKNLKFLRTLINAMPNPFYCKNLKGEYTDCNTHFEEFIGLNREKIINYTVFDINQDELAIKHHEEDIMLMTKGGEQVYESKLKFTNGTEKDVLFSKATILSEDGDFQGIVGVITDITERKKVEEKMIRLSKLKEAMLQVNQSIIGIENINELFNLILEKAIESIKGAEYGSILVLIEEKCLKMTASKGYDKEKSKEFCIPLEHSFQWIKTGGNIRDTIIIDDINKLDNNEVMYVSSEGEKWNIKSCISSPIIIDNKLYGMLNIDSDKIGAFTEEDLEIMMYMRNQIQIAISKHKLYEEITYLSRYDKLTNIYNRRYFEDVLYNKMHNFKEFSLVIFDLNGLKFVNDNYGHLEGDEYIRTFVKGLNNIMKTSDILARYGGDEFIGVFLSDTKTLTKMFEDLLNYFRNNPINVADNNIACSFSYGIAKFPLESDSYDELIRIADDRMYKLKHEMKAKNL